MKQAKPKKTSRLYKVLRWLLWVGYPKIKVEGTENLPEDEPAILVGNHSQMHGPIACEFYIPGRHHTWCAAQMMKLREVPAYAYTDFWAQKPPYSRPFYRLLSYLIAPLAALIFNNANTIPVYRDHRITITLKRTLKYLQDGERVVIFPEHDVKRNNILYEFQDGFVDMARLYHKRNGKELCFVPLYIAPIRKTMYFGKPIRFSAETPIEWERHRICEYLMTEITQMARQLPKHTVIPYRNIPRRQYPTNRDKEETL